MLTDFLQWFHRLKFQSKSFISSSFQSFYQLSHEIQCLCPLTFFYLFLLYLFLPYLNSTGWFSYKLLDKGHTYYYYHWLAFYLQIQNDIHQWIFKNRWKVSHFKALALNRIVTYGSPILSHLGYILSSLTNLLIESPSNKRELI